MKIYLMSFLFLLSLSFSSMFFDPIQMGISPKSISSGGSFPARPDGASSGFFNPSLLRIYDYNQVRFSYASILDLSYINIAGLIQTPVGPIMIGVASIGVSNLPSTYLDVNGVVRKGAEILNSNTLLTGATAFSVYNVPVGIALKLYTGGLAESSSLGFNANIGTYFTPINNLQISGYIVNALPLVNQVQWTSGRYEYLPTTFALGATFSQPLYILSLSTAYYDAYTPEFDHLMYNLGASVDLFGATLSGVIGKDVIRAKETYVAFGMSLDLNFFETSTCMTPCEMDEGSYVYFSNATLTFKPVPKLLPNKENSVTQQTQKPTNPRNSKTTR